MQSLRKKVLIVEGDRLTGREVAAVLDNAGFETIEILPHEDPLLNAELEQPSLIVLDITSPERNGFADFWALRESHRAGPIPIIALTDGDRNNAVYYAPEDFETAFGVRGPEGILEKPVNAGFLVTCVMGLLG